MYPETYSKLSALKISVLDLIPDTADLESIWGYLGWDSDCAATYPLAKAYGLDLRPLMAPLFSDVVSIVVDGAYGFPYNPKDFTWFDILNGQVTNFKGKNPKERMLSVIDCVLKNSLHS